MKLDNEEQRKVLMDVINNGNFVGTAVEYIADLKRRVARAEIDVPMNAKQPTQMEDKKPEEV